MAYKYQRARTSRVGLAPKTLLAFRVDVWDAAGNNLVDHLAGLDNHGIAVAAHGGRRGVAKGQNHARPGRVPVPARLAARHSSPPTDCRRALSIGRGDNPEYPTAYDFL
jgi:hypothetical protein